MVVRMGHIALRVRDLDDAVAFQCEVLGMTETERSGRTAYLTCNDRHHELILIEDPVCRGVDHVGLEVADVRALETAGPRVEAAGGRVAGGVHDGEPGIDRALRVAGPGGLVIKLFCGMEGGGRPAAADGPQRFEHVSIKSPRPGVLERFLAHGLGFRLSDRMGRLASWWHCDADHHGMAITLAPRAELSHYAYTFADLNAMGAAADRLKLLRGQRLIWGPSRHGPGNNRFMYLHDADGAMVELCSDLARMPPDGDYEPRRWPAGPKTINQWGGPPPARFLLTGFPLLGADAGARSRRSRMAGLSGELEQIVPNGHRHLETRRL